MTDRTTARVFAALDDLGLQAAVDWYLTDFSRRTGVRSELSSGAVLPRLPSDIELAAYRIVQEALTNIARHAHATSCRVTLRRNHETLEVIVEDNGRGFNAGELERAPRRGLGLLGVTERVTHLNGQISIRSGLGQGTKLTIALPCGCESHDSEDVAGSEDAGALREPARG